MVKNKLCVLNVMLKEIFIFNRPGEFLVLSGNVKGSVGDPNPNPKGSERFEGSESDQTVRIRILIRKDPKANYI